LKLDLLINNNNDKNNVLIELSTLIEAEIMYIRGRALDCIDGILAESLLSKSVKLDPTNCNAWTALGICLWKKDNKNDAKSCFLESIKQKPNKEALCELSILTRQILSKDQKLSIDESINLAKQAIQLDLSYHKSWYVFGNANCTRFFSVSQDVSDLNKAFAAYKRSEILVNGDKNPDLYFTKGNVSRYLQHYDIALKSYYRARELDESLSQITDGPISEIITFQNSLYETFSEKLDPAIISKCKSEILSASFTRGSISLDKLQLGLNKKLQFAAYVIRLIPNGSENMPPSTYLCIDAIGNMCAVSLYNIGQNDSNIIKTCLKNNEKTSYEWCIRFKVPMNSVHLTEE
jgi:tetratricopeptide (TPR) repeat protein